MSMHRGVVLFTAAVFAMISGVAHAAPAQQRTQVPGYYRMALGDFEITALNDGYLDLDLGIFTGTPKEKQALLEKAFQPAGKTFRASVNAYLVHTGSRLVLVDAGANLCFGPTGGGLPKALEASGYTPDQIDTVIITHLHGDHACGLVTQDGKAFFPEAEVRVAKSEADFWAGSQPLDKFPEGMRPFVKMARDSLAPYIAAGKFKTFNPGETLAPGVVAEATVGHTPGHTSFRISSKGQELLVLGDLVHSFALQLPKPKTAIAFDVDGKKAVPMREKIFAKLAKDKTWVAAEHFPFPGLGHLRKDGAGYVWVPVEYGALK